MREVAREKLGFYPCPLEVVDMVTDIVSADPNAVIVDPCAGEGEAVQRLAHNLGVSEERVVAAELEYNRSQTLAARMPTAQIAANTDFQSAYAPWGAASLAWLNAPFDNEAGRLSERTEATFLLRMNRLLRPGGVLAMIVPEQSIPEVRLILHNYYESVQKIVFPKSLRKFNEVVILAVRRQRALIDEYAPASMLASPYDGREYFAPAGDLFQFDKREYTDDEIERLIAIKPGDVIGIQAGRSVLRPPLQLGMGHIALLLAAGHLDGPVRKKGKPPHVVRGTSRKIEVVADATVTGGEKVVVSQEKIELVIRIAHPDGRIEDLSNA